MKYRKGVFLVVRNKDKYLLLHRKLHWKGWEFPKGGVETGESYSEAIKREIREETGLKIKKIIDMKKSGKFRYEREFPDREGIEGMSWKLFAVEVYPGKIKVDKLEHDKYSWKNYNSAYKLLSYEDKKRCLRIVEKRFNK